MQVEINGLDEILQRLTQLNVSEELESKALNKAGNVTKEAIIKESTFGKRSRSESGKGTHSRGIYKKNIILKRPKNGETIIHSGGAYHAHLIEFGRSGGSVITRKGRKVTWGPTAPNPIFARGFEQSKDEAKEVMISELQKGLGL